MTQITVLIVTFNNAKTIHNCLCALMKSDDVELLDIRIWDNASNDGTADIIEQSFPTVQLTRFDQNIGFGAALNTMTKDICTSEILLLNPDSEVLPDVIPKMRQVAEMHKNAGIVGALTIVDSNAPPEHALLGQITLSSLWLRALGLARVLPKYDKELTKVPSQAEPFDVDLVEGSCMLIRRSLWIQLGGFDPAFFLYGEDHDLCLRARALGARILIAPKARFAHVSAGSTFDPTLRKILLLGGRAELCRRSLPEAQINPAIRALKVGVWLRQFLHHKSDIDWRDVWSKRAIWTIAPPHLTKQLSLKNNWQDHS